MNETIITLAGNLVTDVDLRTTSRGDALARFRLASTATRYDRANGRWVDGDTTYWNVTAWRRTAQNAAASLAKGQPVIVQGRVRQRTVDRAVAEAPGVTVPVTFTDLEATHLGLDLARCRSQYLRAPIGPQTEDLGGLDAGEPSGLEVAGGPVVAEVGLPAPVAGLPEQDCATAAA
jgi:single-strand DNA-binding protein